jgi:hypothetical protein
MGLHDWELLPTMSGKRLLQWANWVLKLQNKGGWLFLSAWVCMLVIEHLHIMEVVVAQHIIPSKTYGIHAR